MAGGRLRAGERAYRQLRADVVNGTLAAGTALLEVEQASRMGVSRTPVREALGRLVADGLVTPHGRRGLRVAQLGRQDVGAVFEMRICLESEQARLAARRRDLGRFASLAARFRQATFSDEQAVASYYALIAEFDQALDEACANDYLVEALTSLRTHATRLRRLAKTSSSRLAASAAEHALIAHAVEHGDASLAADATHVHLHNSREHLLATLVAH